MACAFYYFKELDIKTMNKAAALLVGTHDFRGFQQSKDRRKSLYLHD